MFLLRLFVGLLFIVLGLGYLFDRKAILRLNAFMRDYFFKDSHVLLDGKRIGVVLLFIGFFILTLSFQTRQP